jgi:alanine dehydrogenase
VTVGVPSEVKADEYRVGLLPVGAHMLVADGHRVLIQSSAGIGSGFEDAQYREAGAEIVATDELYAGADLIIKVKEPQPDETAKLRSGQTVFAYFHFAAERALTEALLGRNVTAVAYETLLSPSGQLPLLKPMSEVAGKMSVQEGAKYLEKPMMGRGILLGGVPGVEPAHVLVRGGGVVGTNAARVAAGLGAHVVIMDIDLERLRHLSEVMPANVTTLFSDPHAIREHLPRADLVIAAVLTPRAKSPTLVPRSQLARMKNGAVVVDVGIDQGGALDTSRPTTHQDPTYLVDGVAHYCVTNMPGAVGRTSSLALCNATLPYARSLARLGPHAFATVATGHAAAINISAGQILHPMVHAAFPDLPYHAG